MPVQSPVSSVVTSFSLQLQQAAFAHPYGDGQHGGSVRGRAGLRGGDAVRAGGTGAQPHPGRGDPAPDAAPARAAPPPGLPPLRAAPAAAAPPVRPL
jgi:hypothetical protein